MDEQQTQDLKQHLEVTEKANREIRDNLAIERTEFANERTFLAFMRTALGLIVAGFSLVQFFQDRFYVWIGVLFLPAGLILGLLGLQKFLTRRRHITGKRSAYKAVSHLHAKVAAAEKCHQQQSGLRQNKFFRKR
ncbi:MAG TPA: DUF202 domain-containing protein [Adhaeribacter sp.]|nr:DUF202 domain-containing protein [Adhaeribacter sp.]